MEILTWIKYTECKRAESAKRGRQTKYYQEEDRVPIELAETFINEMVPAFVVEGDGRVYFWYKNQLYIQAYESDIWAGNRGYSALKALEYVNAHCSSYFGFDPEDTRELMITKAEMAMSKYLLVDGQLYVTVGEPRYHVTTFGCGNNHGGTALMVSNDYNPNCSLDCYFSALDADLAIQEAERVARDRGDTNDLGTFRAAITVLLPEAVKLPRKSYPGIPLGDLSAAPKIGACTNCGYYFPIEQISLKENSSARWRICPMCGKSINWEAVVPIKPHEVHCKICGSWLGTLEANGRSYASSDYNGTDVCDSCMSEHCAGTNCFACKIGHYPECEFLRLKTD